MNEPVEGEGASSFFLGNVSSSLNMSFFVHVDAYVYLYGKFNAQKVKFTP